MITAPPPPQTAVRTSARSPVCPPDGSRPPQLASWVGEVGASPHGAVGIAQLRGLSHAEEGLPVAVHKLKERPLACGVYAVEPSAGQTAVELAANGDGAPLVVWLSVFVHAKVSSPAVSTAGQTPVPHTPSAHTTAASTPPPRVRPIPGTRCGIRVGVPHVPPLRAALWPHHDRETSRPPKGNRRVRRPCP